MLNEQILPALKHLLSPEEFNKLIYTQDGSPFNLLSKFDYSVQSHLLVERKGQYFDKSVGYFKPTCIRF